MTDLILIRHSLSQQQPGTSAHEWELTAAGQALCRPLAARLAAQGLTRLYTSAEPKARATGELVAQHLGGLPCAVHGALHETRRETAPYFAQMADFYAAIQAAMQQPEALLFGEETFAAAQARFAAAVQQLMAAHPGETLGLVTHGTVLALYLAAQTGSDPYPLWRSLKLPAYARLRLPAGTLLELVPEIA